MQSRQKSTKSRTKTLIFTTLDTAQLEKLVIIGVNIDHASGYIECNSVEEKNGNKYLIFASVDKNKEVLKNMQMFGMELKTK